MAEYYLLEDGERRGPFTVAQLSREGIDRERYVWSEGFADRRRAGEGAALAEVVPSQRPSNVNVTTASAPTSRSSGRSETGAPAAPLARYSDRIIAAFALVGLVSVLVNQVITLLAINGGGRPVVLLTLLVGDRRLRIICIVLVVLTSIAGMVGPFLYRLVI